MKLLFVAALALCLTASALCGCATEKPAETTTVWQVRKTVSRAKYYKT